MRCPACDMVTGAGCGAKPCGTHKPKGRAGRPRKRGYCRRCNWRTFQLNEAGVCVVCVGAAVAAKLTRAA